MSFRSALCGLIIALFCLHGIQPVWGQDAGTPGKDKPGRNTWIMHHLSDRDVVLTLTSIEWGVPDRWSFTSRYVHMFEKDRDDRTWLNNLSVSVSPGTAGGRFGIGYQNIFTPPSVDGFALLSELRLVWVRTWRNPLTVRSNRTLLGPEIRFSVGGLFTISLGHYTPISGSEKTRDSFFGLHFGLGI